MKRMLSKAEQEKLAWIWQEDAGLQLVYKSFNQFVESRVGKYTTNMDEWMEDQGLQWVCRRSNQFVEPRVGKCTTNMDEALNEQR